MSYLWVLGAALLAPVAEKPIPKVVLVGDSIRLAYAPLVAKKLAGKARVVSPAENGIDTPNVLAKLDAWVISEKPDLVCLNCGLHDLKRDRKTGKHQVELDDYAANLKKIATRIQQGSKARLVFVLTTPVDDERHARRGLDFDRFTKDIVRYNEAARKAMQSIDVPVFDLHRVVSDSGAAKLLDKDGVHYTPEGNALLATALTEEILRRLGK